MYHIFLYNIGYEVGSAKIWNFKFCSIFTKVFIIYESWCRDRSSSVEMTTVEDCIRRLALWAENPSWGLKINALTSSGKKSRSPNMENWNDGAIILFKYGPIFLYFRMSWQRIQSSGRLTELKSVFVCGQLPKDPNNYLSCCCCSGRFVIYFSGALRVTLLGYTSELLFWFKSVRTPRSWPCSVNTLLYSHPDRPRKWFL